MFFPLNQSSRLAGSTLAAPIRIAFPVTMLTTRIDPSLNSCASVCAGTYEKAPGKDMGMTAPHASRSGTSATCASPCVARNAFALVLSAARTVSPSCSAASGLGSAAALKRTSCGQQLI